MTIQTMKCTTQKIENEMTYLNKTKSQMIWLLKQVITVETKMKMKQQQQEQKQQQQQQSPQPPPK